MHYFWSNAWNRWATALPAAAHVQPRHGSVEQGKRGKPWFGVLSNIFANTSTNQPLCTHIFCPHMCTCVQFYGHSICGMTVYWRCELFRCVDKKKGQALIWSPFKQVCKHQHKPNIMYTHLLPTYVHMRAVVWAFYLWNDCVLAVWTLPTRW